MPNMTLSLPEETYAFVKSHPEIRWSHVARSAIERYARQLEVVDRILQDSRLSGEDVEELDRLVKSRLGQMHRELAAGGRRGRGKEVDEAGD